MDRGAARATDSGSGSLRRGFRTRACTTAGRRWDAARGPTPASKPDLRRTADAARGGTSFPRRAPRRRCGRDGLTIHERLPFPSHATEFLVPPIEALFDRQRPKLLECLGQGLIDERRGAIVIVVCAADGLGHDRVD